jgi:hypothetical protein
VNTSLVSERLFEPGTVLGLPWILSR